jgi:uncharacterized protein (TIGR03382 family)
MAADTWSDPYPGVRRLHRQTSDQNINALVVDLCAAGVSVRATAMSERGRVVSSFGQLVGAQAAINGDFFSSTYSTDGPARGNGMAWGGADHAYVAPAQFGDHQIALPEHQDTAGVASWAKEVVSGHPTLLAGGQPRGNNGDALCTNRHPRTVIGFNADKTKLYAAVVDGRATGRLGMTCDELIALLQGLGASDAVNLDGGGSSTMWLANAGVLNYPSDGHERVVGNHLAIRATGSGAAAHCPTRPAWAAQYVSQSWPLASSSMHMFAGQTIPANIELRNVGSKPWDQNTKLGTTQARDRASAFADASWLSPSRASHVASGTIAPNQTYKFTFNFHAPGQAGTFHEFFSLVQEGVAWFSDPGQGGPPDNQIEAWIEVTLPKYSGEAVAMSFPTDQPYLVGLGQKFDGWIDLKNVGTEGWTAGRTKLAPLPPDQDSALANTGWLSPTRVSTLSSDVAPGATGRFPIAFYGNAVGDYMQSFTLVEEGVTWFSDPANGGQPQEGALRVHMQVTPDAQNPDQGGGNQDGGVDGGPPGQPGGGCSIVTAGGTPVVPLVLLVLTWLVVRRRARR